MKDPWDCRTLSLTVQCSLVFFKVVGERGHDPTDFDRILIIWDSVVFHFVVFVALTQRICWNALGVVYPTTPPKTIRD